MQSYGRVCRRMCDIVAHKDTSHTVITGPDSRCCQRKREHAKYICTAEAAATFGIYFLANGTFRYIPVQGGSTYLQPRQQHAKKNPHTQNVPLRSTQNINTCLLRNTAAQSRGYTKNSASKICVCEMVQYMKSCSISAVPTIHLTSCGDAGIFGTALLQLYLHLHLVLTWCLVDVAKFFEILRRDESQLLRTQVHPLNWALVMCTCVSPSVTPCGASPTKLYKCINSSLNMISALRVGILILAAFFDDTPTFGDRVGV